MKTLRKTFLLEKGFVLEIIHNAYKKTVKVYSSNFSTQEINFS